MDEPLQPAGERAPSLPIRLALLALAVAALAGSALIVAIAPVADLHHDRGGRTHEEIAPSRPAPVVPKAKLPPVEPIRFRDFSPDAARAYNDTIPFSDAPNPAARPFHISGDPDSRARARGCMATAVLYEAGDDSVGEKAVAQVVLNRVRHPAFPNSVCGVVFQGAGRPTGCQFTFTCDGALDRDFSDAAWKRAREVADAALDGTVEKSVGEATHYHTDWVVPYWSASLDKVTAVGTHLFFRWTGWWGTPPAFAMRYTGAEPRVPALANRFDAHKTPEEREAATAGTVDAATVDTAALPTPLASDPNVFLVTLDPSLDPATLPSLATRACGARSYCKLMAWRRGDTVPSALPIGPKAIRTMAFSYLRNRANGFEKALWNCDLYKHANKANCMHRVAAPKARPEAKFKLDDLPGSKKREAAPDVLEGVHRKPRPTPKPTTPR